MKKRIMQRVITTCLVVALVIAHFAFINPTVSAYAQADLTVPQNIGWKAGTLATAQWDAVEGADYYVLNISVFIAGELQGTTETGTSKTETDIQQQIRNLAPEGVDQVNVYFSVKAINTEENIEGSYSVNSSIITYNLSALETIDSPTDVELSEEYVVSFKMVYGADHYIVTIYAEGDGGWATDTKEFGYIDNGYMYLDLSDFIASYYRDRGYYGETINFYADVEAVSSDGRTSAVSEKSNNISFYFDSPLQTPEFVSIEVNEDGKYIYTFKCYDEFITYYELQLNMVKCVYKGSEEASVDTEGRAELRIIRIDPENYDSFTSLDDPGYYSLDISDILRYYSILGSSINNDYPVDIGIRIRSIASFEGEGDLYSAYSSLGTIANYNEPAVMDKIENPIIESDGESYTLSFDAIQGAEGYDVEYHVWGTWITAGASADFPLQKCVVDNGKCYIDITELIEEECHLQECEGQLLFFSLSVRAYGDKDKFEIAPFSEETNAVRYYSYGSLLEEIELAPANPILAVGNQLYLGKTVSPDNGYYESIVWSSNNDKVASVDNEGCISAIGVGSAVITALVDKTVSNSVTVNTYVVYSNISDDEEAAIVEDISGDIIDDIGNNENPDISNTDINTDDLESIKEDILSGIENGDTFHTDIQEIQKYFESYKNNWGQIKKAAGDLNVEFAGAYNIDVEMYHKDKEGNQHHIGNITELENEISFTIDLVGNSGKYVLVRVHKNAKGEEEYEQISYTVNDDGSLNVSSNKFSDFVVLSVVEEVIADNPINKQLTELTISGNDRELVYGGNSITLSASVENEGDNGLFTWSSSSPSAIKIDDNGNITIVGAGTSTITCSYDSDQYYGESEVALEVKKANLSIDSITIKTKEYDGTTIGEIENVVLKGMVKDDGFSLGNGLVATFADQNAGENKEVIISNISFIAEEGTTVDNYSFDITDFKTTGIITSKKVNITWKGKSFDQDGYAHVPTADVSGIIEKDNYNLNISVTAKTGYSLSENEAKQPGEYNASLDIIFSEKDKKNNYSINETDLTYDFSIAASSQQLECTHNNIVVHEAKSSTCTENGNSKYYYCSDCHKYFNDAECKNEIASGSWIISSHGHNMSYTSPTEATCIHNGNIGYYTCSTCGGYFTDSNGNNRISSNNLTTTGTHKLSKVEAVEATYDKNGNIEYYICSECQKWFSDSNGTNEITEEESIISKKKKESITKADFTLKKKIYKYTGKEIKPTVTVKINEKTLKKNKDYKISYKNNIKISKNAKIVIRGIGDYTGTQTIKFEIQKKTVNVKTVTLSKSKLNVKKGNTILLKATINPKNATNKKVTWKSSDSKIATVDKNGKVTAKKKGTCTITVTTEDGKKTAKCKVTVK